MYCTHPVPDGSKDAPASLAWLPASDERPRVPDADAETAPCYAHIHLRYQVVFQSLLNIFLCLRFEIVLIEAYMIVLKTYPRSEITTFQVHNLLLRYHYIK